MVGPVVKIDPATLPQRTNIAWLGQQAYDDLPAFISGWDLCLLPFALNEATRFISPTKTAVSTPIRDVVEPYSHLVAIAATAGDFIHACEAVLGRSERERACHADAMAEVVARTSWDATAEAMATLIEQADVQRRGEAAWPPAGSAQSLSASSPWRTRAA